MFHIITIEMGVSGSVGRTSFCKHSIKQVSNRMSTYTLVWDSLDSPSIMWTCCTVEPLNQDTLKIRTPRYRGQFLLSQILHLCTFQPLKSGHVPFEAPRTPD